MASDFASLGEKGQHYWYLLADHTATKTRELGRVTGYERAGVKYTRIRAHLDDKTTKICRALHNKIVSVENMRQQRDSYLEAISEMNAEKAKETWPMMKDSQAEGIDQEDFKNREPDKLPKNVGMPPYHFLCRTITVVEFEYKPAKPVAPSETDKPAKPAKPVSSEWKFVPNSQLGSNPGAKVYSPDGILHYAKFYNNPEQARHEHLANTLLEELGAGTLESQLKELEFNGTKRLAIVTKWIDEATPLKNLKDKKFSKTDKDQLTKQYLSAALVGNWDVVGLDFDNLAKKGKRWYCLDQGGTFHFRAQGGRKDYKPDAPEFESILAPGRKAGSIFNPILADTLKETPEKYSKWLKELNRKKIRGAVESAGIHNNELVETIIQRTEAIQEKIKAFAREEKQHTRLHLNKKSRQDKIDLIKEDGRKCGLEISDNVANQIIEDIYDFSCTGYKNMRDAQFKRIDNPKALQQATLIEEYLDVAAYYPMDTPLYRLMRKKRETVGELHPGEEYHLKALASSSTSYEKAFNFLNNKQEDIMLIIEGGTKYGTTIKHIARFPEREVLLSGRNNLEIIEKYIEDGLLHVRTRVKEIKPPPIRQEILRKGQTKEKRRSSMTLEEKIEMVNQHEMETPMFIKKLDGSQWLILDDWKEEVTPDHPLYEHQIEET